MTYTYPLTLPTNYSAYSLGRISINVISVSPFTLQQQSARGLGEAWDLALTFPIVVDPVVGRTCSTFMSKLHGTYGTYYFPIPSRDLSYVLPGGKGTMGLVGINNDMRTNVKIDCVGGSLGVGTYVTIGQQLLQVENTFDSGSGIYDVDIFPFLRNTFATGSTLGVFDTPVEFAAPKGVFRQKSEIGTVSFDNNHLYSFALDGQEAF